MSDAKQAEPVLSIRPERVPAEDIQAKWEIQALEKQELDADRRRREHARQEKLRGVFAFGVRALVVLIFLVIVAALLSLVWHYLAPAHMHWIADDALEKVGTVLFSGPLFVFLSLYIRDRV